MIRLVVYAVLFVLVSIGLGYLGVGRSPFVP